MMQIEALRAGYGSVEVLHGVTTRVQQGRLTALVGPNGCGKSTFIKAAAGHLRPDTGRILLCGRTLGDMSPREIARQVAYMPQSRPVADIAAMRLVEHGRYPHLGWGRVLGRADHAMVDAAMERTGTARLAARPLSTLSGGERQRVYIAMMLCQDARLLLMDEPTTYLDAGTQFSVMGLLRALAAEGRAVCVVLHDLPLALNYADALIVMEKGRVSDEGAPQEVAVRGTLSRAFGVEVGCAPEGYWIFARRGQDGADSLETSME